METRHWFDSGKPHHIDTASIKEKCFLLLNIFNGNRAAMRKIEVEEDEINEHCDVNIHTAFKLHRELAFPVISRLLLEIAINVRTCDDIMRQSEMADLYGNHADGYDIGSLIITGKKDLSCAMSLRKVCSKIIHARTIRPLDEGIDRLAALMENGSERQELRYLTGEIDLEGCLQDQKDWWAYFYVGDFVDAVVDWIDFLPLANAAQS